MTSKLESQFNRIAYKTKLDAPDRRHVKISQKMQGTRMTATDSSILRKHVNVSGYRSEINRVYGPVKTVEIEDNTFHIPVFFIGEKLSAPWYFFIWPQSLRQVWVSNVLRQRKEQKDAGK